MPSYWEGYEGHEGGGVTAGWKSRCQTDMMEEAVYFG